MVKPKKAGQNGAVAHAVVTKPKGTSNRKNTTGSSNSNTNPLVPSLLRKTKGGNGFGVNRLKLPFGGTYHRGATAKTAATAVPGQSFPEMTHGNAGNDTIPVVVGHDTNDVPPPFTNVTADSVQISDLTEPPMMATQQREPPPVDEIHTLNSGVYPNGSGVESVTSSLSHSIVSRIHRKEKNVAAEMQHTAALAVNKVVQAAEMVVQDGIELIHQTLLEQSCPAP